MDVIAVGKIKDIFAGQGVTESYPIKNNNDGMEITNSIAEKDFRGLCFVNLVDFDMVFGHRNDIEGYAKAVSEFDLGLAELLSRLRDDDVLIITADHGCDPSTPSTDHSREYVPLLVYGRKIKQGVNLGGEGNLLPIRRLQFSKCWVRTVKTDGVSYYKEIKYVR